MDNGLYGKLCVICSFSEKPLRVTMPGSWDMVSAKQVLTSLPEAQCDRLNERSFTLKPYETRVYYCG